VYPWFALCNDSQVKLNIVSVNSLDVPPVITLMLVRLQWPWYYPFYHLHIRATSYWILVWFVITQDILSCRLEEETCLAGSEIFPLVVTLRVVCPAFACVSNTASVLRMKESLHSSWTHTWYALLHSSWTHTWYALQLSFMSVHGCYIVMWVQMGKNHVISMMCTKLGEPHVDTSVG